MCLLKPEAILIQLNKKIKKCYNFYKNLRYISRFKKIFNVINPNKIGLHGS